MLDVADLSLQADPHTAHTLLSMVCTMRTLWRSVHFQQSGVAPCQWSPREGDYLSSPYHITPPHRPELD